MMQSTMPRQMAILAAILFAATAVGDEASPVVVSDPGVPCDLTARASDTEIASLIGDLSHPDFQVRARATRRLCAIGPRAQGLLEATAKGADFEAALRAQRLLHTFANIAFWGVEVTLEVPHRPMAWDEPFDLIVRLRNSSQYRAHVPFELDPHKRALLGDDARQVGDMLDVAELVRVRRTDGTDVRIKIDNVEADKAILGAVEQRLAASPVSHIPPGAEATLTVKAFNRGWARYPMLDSGAYRISFAYGPEWEDQALTKAGVGTVASQEVVVTIATSAPPAVSREDASPMSIRLVAEGGRLSVSLTNRHDRPIVVNTNIGVVAPFARAHWSYRQGDKQVEVPAVKSGGRTWDDFDDAKLVTLAPGGTVALAHVASAELATRLAAEGIDVAAGGQLRFGYGNVCGRAWQARGGAALLGNRSAPTALQTLLPTSLVIGHHTSEPLSWPR